MFTRARNRISIGLLVALALWMGPCVEAQLRPRTPLQTSFQSAWTLTLPDRARLIEIGQVTDAHRNSLLQVIESTNANDFRRRLLLSHWDGIRFSVDYETEFFGTAVDALLAGVFHPTAPIVVQPPGGSGAPPGTPPPKEKHGPKPVQLAPQQVVTTEGIYSWTGKGLVRHFTAPTNIKLALVRDHTPDLLVTGFGDASNLFDVSGTEAHVSLESAPREGDGYVRYGAGTQDFSGSERLALKGGARFVQSLWSGRTHWLVGLVPGPAAPTTDLPDARSGDRIVVMGLPTGRREGSFWAVKPDDLEELWSSDALPGRVLDVRIGDPRNEGHDGILVLTAENGEKLRVLRFFVPVTGVQSR